MKRRHGLHTPPAQTLAAPLFAVPDPQHPNYHTTSPEPWTSHHSELMRQGCGAGAALPCRAVLEAQHRFLDLEAATGGCVQPVLHRLVLEPWATDFPSPGRYEAVEQETQALRRPYAALAKMLNCSSDEIAVTPSATHAWNQVDCNMPPPGYWLLQLLLLRYPLQNPVRSCMLADKAAGAGVLRLASPIRRSHTDVPA